MASFPYSSVLITGSNRGIGLNLVKAILNASPVPKHIFATCRSLKVENAKELRNLAESKNSNVHVLEFDLADVAGPRLPELVKQVSDIVQESGLNLLINNAAINTKRRFNDLSVESMRSTYEVNTIGPVMITRAFRPLLKQAAVVKLTGNQPEAAVVNISSILGSIENTKNAPYLGYQSSKAALNMATKAISGEFAKDGITIVSIHPGWVKTDMGGPNAHLTVGESGASIIKTISSLQRSQSGSFLNYDGTVLPW